MGLHKDARCAICAKGKAVEMGDRLVESHERRACAGDEPKRRACAGDEPTRRPTIGAK